MNDFSLVCPPRTICTRCFVGFPLTHGSWWGNIVNRKSPRGGGGSFDEIDKLRLSSWLVTLASGHSSNHLTSDSLSSQLVKSTCVVSPLKSHPQAVPRTPPEGYWGGVRSRSWPKKKVKTSARTCEYFISSRRTVFAKTCTSLVNQFVCEWFFAHVSKKKPDHTGCWNLETEPKETCCVFGTTN